MPTIAIFAGIVVQMYFEDHDPPHFHVVYADRRALVRIEDGAILRGSLPRRQERLVRLFATMRRAELLENWSHAQTDGRLVKVPGPLDA